MDLPDELCLSLSYFFWNFLVGFASSTVVYIERHFLRASLILINNFTMTEQQQIALLLHKYLQGSLTETENLLLEDWRKRSEINQRFFDALQNEEQLSRWIA